jgi:hypothetical protein
MRLKQFGEELMFLPFQRRSAAVRREPYLPTFLLSLVRVHLSNWVDGPF